MSSGSILSGAVRGDVQTACHCDRLGLGPAESSPDHGSLTRIRDRYPVKSVEEVFAFVLKMALERKLISATRVGVAATLLEVNAVMKLIVRGDTDEGWKESRYSVDVSMPKSSHRKDLDTISPSSKCRERECRPAVIATVIATRGPMPANLRTSRVASCESRLKLRARISTVGKPCYAALRSNEETSPPT